jgi:hypothetical protein
VRAARTDESNVWAAQSFEKTRHRDRNSWWIERNIALRHDSNRDGPVGLPAVVDNMTAAEVDN